MTYLWDGFANRFFVGHLLPFQALPFPTPKSASNLNCLHIVEFSLAIPVLPAPCSTILATIDEENACDPNDLCLSKLTWDASTRMASPSQTWGFLPLKHTTQSLRAIPQSPSHHLHFLTTHFPCPSPPNTPLHAGLSPPQHQVALKRLHRLPHWKRKGREKKKREREQQNTAESTIKRATKRLMTLFKQSCLLR